MLRIPLALVASLLVTPLAAQTPPALNIDEGVAGQKGGVAQMALAQELFAQGMRLTDAALVIAAAKLVQGVTLTDVVRERVAGDAPAPAETAPPDAAAILAAARKLAGEDEVYLSLLDEAEAPEAKGRFGGASRQRSALLPGGSEGWRVPFFGESYAEVGVLAGAPVRVVITDAAGNRMWCPSGPQMNFHCGFAPRENGYFTITVDYPEAAGGIAAQAGPIAYDLLTN